MPQRYKSTAYQSSTSLGYKCHTGCTSVAIKQAITSDLIKKAITLTLNATQGHKHSYQTSYYFDSKCHTGTQA